MRTKINHYIFGEEFEGRGRNGDVENPATGEILRQVP